jgi:hypothetical protein
MKRKRESNGNILEIRPLNAEDAAELWPVPIPVPELKTEADWYVKHWGISESEARVHVIIRWMQEGGDLGPLAVHLAEGPIDPWVANVLVRMIKHRQLEVVRKRGSPKKPELFARAIITARAYEGRKGPSGPALEQLAAEQHRSVKAIEAEITGVRKREI